ncbi:MAG: DUF131 domain-containing protein [Candidatus Bathyarchaeota archaeon]|nr:DUF131 domain-containing protein [Candidatus Bathyarchaeota archaeon]
MDTSAFFSLGTLLIIVGVIVVILAVILSSTSRGDREKAKVKGAGVVMIGPIPIIFGTDKKSATTVVALALALTIILIVYYLLVR